MSTENQKPIHSSKSSPQSMLSKNQSDGVSQRAQDLTCQHRESRTTSGANGENRETLVSVKVPQSMQDKVRSLTNYMGLSRGNLINTSIQCIISYAQDKEIEIPNIKGYPKNKIFEEAERLHTQEVELTGKVFEELKKQNLLSNVSECAVLGLELLYLRLIELNKVG